MNRKVYDPFAKMSKKQRTQMIEIDAESRNLKEREFASKKKTNKTTSGAGNFLGIQDTKTA